MPQKFTSVVLLLLAAFFIPTAAQTGAFAERKAVVAEFYRLINPDSKEVDLYNLIDAQEEESGKMLVVMVSSDYRSLEPEPVKALEDLISENRKEISRRLRDKMKPQFDLDKYADTVFESFYNEYFTLDEIKAALDFYKSSAGIKSEKNESGA